ncbi:MAG: UDP-3-O-[3-hydroxymyristoyl] N-acetylglucosamine deacetylase [Gemmataceae bacterium]|nr:UDP-3-O-[3-hydroxymyristoyl] N-acetylglucosamine deacetylase [Gemmataceae bacterium]
MRTVALRFQRTLARPADVAGTGFISGRPIRVRFHPATENAGIVFVRADRPGAPRTPALASFVSDTRRRTTLGSATDGVTLVEHVLAALAGLRVDNCVVELDGPEPPGLDGSAGEFVRAIRDAGIIEQSANRPIHSVRQTVVVARDGASVALHPAADATLRITYALDYGATSPIPRQSATARIAPESFDAELAHCRTFLLESEADALRSQGIGRTVDFADLLVFGERGPIGNTLRRADEPARHKILDLVGDLALTGLDLAGHVVAYRSGHGLNADLARRIIAREAHATAPAVLAFPARRRAA